MRASRLVRLSLAKDPFFVFCFASVGKIKSQPSAWLCSVSLLLPELSEH